MATNNPTSDAGLLTILLLLYAILGSTCVVPAALSIIALVLARSTTVLEFVLQEYEDYHGKHGNGYVARLKTELSRGVRSEVTAQCSLEKAGLKAQLAMVSEELHEVQAQYGRATQKQNELERVIEELRMSGVRIRKDFNILQSQLSTVKSDLEKNQRSAKGLFSLSAEGTTTASSPVPVRASDSGSKASTTAPTGNIDSSIFDHVTPPQVKYTAPSIPALATPRIQLPSQLQTLDPIRPGFRCIGRAIASHGGPCGSFSDEYLPQRGREKAAATLAAMRSPGANDGMYELPALRDLADNMLCVRHCRGTRHDQTHSIASKWHTELSAEVRRKKDEQKVAATTSAKTFSSFTQTTFSTATGSQVNSRPTSPTSSTGSVSTAATTPETLDARSQMAGVGKPLFEFGKNEGFSFATPSPLPK